MAISDRFTQHISHEFNQELSMIHNRVLQMSGLVEEQIKGAIAAISQPVPDNASVRAIVTSDREVNRMDVAINEDCIQILARRQPTASDLRFVIASLKVISELERIGDEAKRIAQKSVHLAESEIEQSYFKAFARIGEQIREMIHQTMDAYARMDAAMATRIIQTDKLIDEDYRLFLGMLQECIARDGSQVKWVLSLIWASRALERIGDHGKNICEQIVFFVEGRDIRYRDSR